MNIQPYDAPARIAGGIDQLLNDESERWGRVRFLARLVALDGADLGDESDVIRCLMSRRYCAADFDEELDDVISEVRQIGRAQQ